MDSYEVAKIIDSETAKTFGIRLAKACNELKSSHVFFVIQQAYPEIGSWMGWEDCQKLLDNILGEETE